VSRAAAVCAIGGPTGGSPRAAGDSCPGALTLHQAQDGWLARLRLPGGFVSALQLSGLADLAEALGDGRLELTSRGNLQLRGLLDSDAETVAAAAAVLGLLPSATHERCRNILASPLAGLDGTVELTSAVQALDAALCAQSRLAELPGRFLFGLDSGGGDVARALPDVLARWSGDRWVVYPGEGQVAGDAVAATMVRAALAFLDERAAQRCQAWRIRELADGPARVAARLGLPQAFSAGSPVASVAGTAVAEVSGLRPAPGGVIQQPDGRHVVIAQIPLGRCTAEQGRMLAGLIAGRPARISASRAVVLPDQCDPDAAVARIRTAGLDCADDSPWRRVSACVGRPGCSHALADVQADARRSVTQTAIDARADGQTSVDARADGQTSVDGRADGQTSVDARGGTLPVHWSGCERRCGHPAGSYLDIVAVGHGYRISQVRA